MVAIKGMLRGGVILLGVLIPLAVSAHVVVKPGQVGIGAFQTFTTGVPNEKDQATVALRLEIPAGLKEVSPNVKPGWTITEKKTGAGEGATVTEIDWTGGQIPAGQRDDFVFSAQAPGQPTELHWKAYQTYADGTVVAWDQTPSGKDDESLTPYSVTKVTDDLNSAGGSATESQVGLRANLALGLAVAALGLAIVGLRRSKSRGA